MLPFDVPEGESIVHKVLRYSDITKISDDRGESYFRNISTIASRRRDIFKHERCVALEEMMQYCLDSRDRNPSDTKLAFIERLMGYNHPEINQYIGDRREQYEELKAKVIKVIRRKAIKLRLLKRQENRYKSFDNLQSRFVLIDGILYNSGLKREYLTNFYDQLVKLVEEGKVKAEVRGKIGNKPKYLFDLRTLLPVLREVDEKVAINLRVAYYSR